MWSQAGVKGHTQTTPQAKARRDGHYQGSDPHQGGRRPGCQGRHHRMCRRRRRVRQPPLSGSEIRRILEASHQSQRPQPLRRSLSLQDGISENGKDHHSERRLDAEVGPKGCLPLCAHSPSPPEVPRVSVGRQAMAVQGTALWSEQCTPNVHQADEASRFHTEETGVPSHPLPGRHTDDGPQQGGGQEGSGRSDGTSLFSGVHHQREEEGFTPARTIEFLGFTLDSASMTISLPQHKLKEIRRSAGQLLRQQSMPARQLARLLGMIVAAHPAVLPAPLHSRFLERAKRRALQGQRGYDAMVRLESNAAQDLQWWVDSAANFNGRPLQIPKWDRVIESDASLVDERRHHINYLELLAAFLALKAFAGGQHGISILLLLDSVTAIAFLNRMGGTHSIPLSDLAVEIWNWCG